MSIGYVTTTSRQCEIWGTPRRVGTGERHSEALETGAVRDLHIERDWRRVPSAKPPQAERAPTSRSTMSRRARREVVGSVA